MKKYILFDLDGTLTDPKEGITTCVQYALASFGIEEPDLDKLEPFIGPPLKESFMNFYQLSEEDAEKAVEKYRERFTDTGIFENQLYGGIHDLLRSLKGAGMHLAVASSKPTVFVERILKHFKIDTYFEAVVGSELDGTRVDKMQVIHAALKKMFGDTPIAYDQVFMVGDRKFDIQGAKSYHIESVGVTYGYGSREELEGAKAEHIVDSVGELKRFLLQGTGKNQNTSSDYGTTKPQDPAVAQRSQSMKTLRRMALNLILFYFVRMIVFNLFTGVIRTFCQQLPFLNPFFLVEQEGELIGYTANSVVISQAVGDLVAVMMIFKKTKGAIIKTAGERAAAGVQKASSVSYAFMGAAAIGIAVGLNLLMEVSGIAESMSAFQGSDDAYFEANLIVALLGYVAVIPFMEEIVFRGMVYNCMRRFMKLPFAIVLSAFVSSVFYTGMSEQAMAFLFGCFLAYIYEYFGCFYVNLVAHVVMNLLLFAITRSGVFQNSGAGLPVCIAALLVMAGSLFLLSKNKKLEAPKFEES